MHAKSLAALCAMSTVLCFTTLAPAQSSLTPSSAAVATSNQSPAAAGTASPTRDNAAREHAVPADSARTNAPRAPKPISSAERDAYAARDAASPDAKNYKGGDAVVVIGASTATVILAVVLLVVLL